MLSVDICELQFRIYFTVAGPSSKHHLGFTSVVNANIIFSVNLVTLDKSVNLKKERVNLKSQ